MSPTPPPPLQLVDLDAGRMMGRIAAADLDLGFLRAHPSAALPPSPFSPSSFAAMVDRPRAPTPRGANGSAWSPTTSELASPIDRMWETPPAMNPHSHPNHLPLRSESLHVQDDDPNYYYHQQQHQQQQQQQQQQHHQQLQQQQQQSYPLPPKRHLPDPAQFPDPYPTRAIPPGGIRSHPPSLVSSADSSSGSARSSAYTSWAGAAAQAHDAYVHVATSSDENEFPHTSATDELRQLRTRPSKASLLPPASPPSSRWTDYGAKVNSRSRASSVAHSTAGGTLRRQPSYDASWQAMDDRVSITSTDIDTDDEIHDDDNEERTEAVLLAEQGRGLIVQAEGKSTVQLEVQPGTTHLLVGSSSTPNNIPQFLAIYLPQTSHSLLALDISANFLVALPPALAACHHLEELNIASNPLRVLPVFLAHLTSLRVLIADSTGISALPEQLNALDKLHIMSLRRNKLVSLPGWLCLLPSLQTLMVDGNPFQGPWKVLLDPLISKEASTPAPPTPGLQPLYTPATPSTFPFSATGVPGNSETDGEDDDDITHMAAPRSRMHTMDEEDNTILAPRPPFAHQSSSNGLQSPEFDDNASIQSGTSSLSRSKTAGGRLARSRADSKSRASVAPSRPQTGNSERKELRKMKSAGELRDPSPTPPPFFPPPIPSPSSQRPMMQHYATSGAVQQVDTDSATTRIGAKFATMGPAGLMSPDGPRTPARSAMPAVFWDNLSGDEASSHEELPHSPVPPLSPKMGAGSHERIPKGEKDRSKWGFLKKMSMARMKPEGSPPQSRPGTATGSRPGLRPRTQTQGNATLPRIHEPPPQLDIRMSVMAPLDVSAADLVRKPSREILKPAPNSMLAPQMSKLSPGHGEFGLLVPTSRSAKRRSFLPLDGPPSLTIPIPSPAPFTGGLRVAIDESVPESPEHDRAETPMSAAYTASSDHRQWNEQERERERAREKEREAYARSLRAVMSYLRDMYDLGLSQGLPPAPTDSLRARRPTIAESGRQVSEHSMMSVASGGSSMMSMGTSSMFSNGSDGSGATQSQLRAMTSSGGLRSGPSSQTASMVSEDSADSQGTERKYKDDKGKRAAIVREIVETERTYVKGLQELVDIYIHPASQLVSNLTGPKQETVVPAQERKAVFGGVESLFQFHKTSFLPALEQATAPLLKSGQNLAEADADGRLSLGVTMAVAHTFVSHAAFMKMYSTYINNFDNSVQRIKSWTSERPSPSVPSTPHQGPGANGQLVGLGLAMTAASVPGVVPDGATGPSARLSSSQRKRIKTWQKRCRMNPRHSQLNMEGYLLLPVQRIPRYRLLIEELLRSTPPNTGYGDDPLDRALSEIAGLANNMNEGKRESESRSKLVKWQTRIKGSSKFPSPLVQPHRRLIMDGKLTLTRVVRKTMANYEILNANGDPSSVQVECLAPELTPRSLIGVLCNDLLVLCRDLSEGRDPASQVELWAVLRMQTVPQPASIVHDDVLRIVDNKAVLYFNAPSTAEALNWYRAINIHIPTAKT